MSLKNFERWIKLFSFPELSQACNGLLSYLSVLAIVDKPLGYRSRMKDYGHPDPLPLFALARAAATLARWSK